MTANPTIRTAAVLGAGTMGAQIAAHLANAGVRVRLLDLTERAARDGLLRASALKPDPFFSRDVTPLITTGSFDDLHTTGAADWIIEAIVERLDVKRELLARVDAARAPGTIVTSNTSGISIAALAEGRSDDFRRHWLGAHFFNPPRYLRLLELIPTAETDPGVLQRIGHYADHRLGKGVVVAKDTPGFIANHVGLYGLMQILRSLEAGGFTIEEVDAITGPAIGRPKSATFRTIDIAGLDIVGHVAVDLSQRLEDEAARRLFELTPLVQRMLDAGLVGEKAGQGFYTRIKGAGGATEILTLDPASLTYRAKQPARLASLDAVRAVDDPAERIRTLFLGRDKVGEFLRTTLAPTLIYTAQVTPAIAHGIDDVDRAMRWGYGWDLGPFELWDAIGISNVLAAAPGMPVPPLVADRQREGHDTFRTIRLGPAGPGLQILSAARAAQRVVRTNPGASLVDLGDGVLALELHSKMNAIGGDTLQMIHAGLKEASANYAALVIGTDAVQFSAGANLMLLLLEAQEGNWDEIDLMVRQFQGATQAIQQAPVPVVIAPAGLALGGGCEIALHGDRVQAGAETYMGLVEVGVGLIPAGGGTKEMLARAMESAPRTDDLLQFVRPVFETIGFGRVSTSARHAHELGYLRSVDGETMNRERLMADAKAVALERVRDGYRPPPKRTAIPVGGETIYAALALGVHLAWRAGRLSDHDAVIGRALARILSGGSFPHRTTVTEDDLLDLEREAFLKLCGERKTLERIQHTLKTGKPLRN
ncbi:MAG: 3-hydroxyacyl-CoA dehydrogenase/enoyl-CoA hydratase family protein [Vicinamibacterales bacterium]